jgi:hypothetical protein
MDPRYARMEHCLWAAKAQGRLETAAALQRRLRRWQEGELKTPWIHYYLAYSALIFAEAGHDVEMRAKQALQALGAAYGAQEGVADFYALAARSCSFLARVAKDPISKARFGMRSDRALSIGEEADPDNPRLQLVKAIILIHRPRLAGGSWRKAEAVLDRTLELFALEDNMDGAAPRWGHPEAHYWRGVCHLHFNRLSDASGSAKCALGIEPNYKSAHALINSVARRL